MGHEQHGRRLRLPEVKEDLAQPVAHRLVERDERLIEQQEGRADGKRAGERDAASLPAGETGRIGIQIAPELHALQEFDAAAIGAGRRVKHDVYVVTDAHPGKQARRLEHVADRGARLGGLAVEVNGAVDFAVESRGNVEERGFPTTGRAQEATELADRNVELQVLDRGVRRRPAISCEPLAADVDGQSCCYRHRVHRRSSGAMTPYSTTIITTTNESV